MTTVVKKGTNRRGHNLRTAKAAQRTPLPPKAEPGTSGSGAAAESLQKLAKRNSKSETASLLKEEFDKQKNPPKGKADGMAKAEELRKLAVEQGWTETLEKPTDDTVVVRLVRGDEEIEVTWVNGVITPQHMPTYSVGTRHVKLRNVSAVRKQLSADPDLRPVKEVSTRSRKAAGSGGDKNGSLPSNSPRRRIPFNCETASDEEIISAIKGRRIKWRNMLAGGKLEEGWIAKEPKSLKIEQHPTRPTRTLTFCDTKGGFRSVALDRLLVVGK